MCKYEQILSKKRAKKSSIDRDSLVDEFYSDRSRIVFCSSFRRLQQKAQVFSLEPNSSVRTRLTHSIEVSDLGRALANKIGYKLFQCGKIEEQLIPVIVAIVENACLLHDIGNPPFGHFGEAAIQAWSKSELTNSAKEAGLNIENSLFKILINDFFEFDGNPQGFRIITKLHCERDEYSLNLSYATLLCGLKYSRVAGDEKDDGIKKKAGYFHTERSFVDSIFKEVGIEEGKRYPLTYIMEAADDIAYCLSDIYDGIEKNIIKPNDFIEQYKKTWDEVFEGQEHPVKLPSNIENFNLDVAVKWSRAIVEEAAEEYINNHEAIFSGTAKQLINDNGMGRILKTIKIVSRRLLYSSPEAENIELTGYAVITGLLNSFGKLLSLSSDEFCSLVRDERIESEKNLEVEKRLYHHIGDRYKKSYSHVFDQMKTQRDFDIFEWHLRVHLIIDHINGMTDDFALATYQMLTGIKVNSY